MFFVYNKDVVLINKNKGNLLVLLAMPNLFYT